MPAQTAYTIAHTGYPDTTFVMSGSLLANSGQLEWGGDYAHITATRDGFVAMWQDFSEGGESRLYSRLVSVVTRGGVAAPTRAQPGASDEQGNGLPTTGATGAVAGLAVLVLAVTGAGRWRRQREVSIPVTEPLPTKR